MGKDPIIIREKMKKKLRGNFLPLTFKQLLFMKLHAIEQGDRFVDVCRRNIDGSNRLCLKQLEELFCRTWRTRQEMLALTHIKISEACIHQSVQPRNTLWRMQIDNFIKIVGKKHILHIHLKHWQELGNRNSKHGPNHCHFCNRCHCLHIVDPILLSISIQIQCAIKFEFNQVNTFATNWMDSWKTSYNIPSMIFQQSIQLFLHILFSRSCFCA